MTYYFSKARGGFYRDDRTPVEFMPADVVALTPAQYQALFAGQAQGRLIQVGQDGSLSNAQPPVDLQAFANRKQAALLLGGYLATVNGQQHRFSCDGEAAGYMASTVMDLTLPNPPTDPVDWQLMDGSFVSVAPADFIPLARRIRAFGQATFTVLKAALAGIAAGTLTTAAQVDGLPWPADHD